MIDIQSEDDEELDVVVESEELIPSSRPPPVKQRPSECHEPVVAAGREGQEGKAKSRLAGS